MITKKEFDLLYTSIKDEKRFMSNCPKTPILRYKFSDKTLIQIGLNHSNNKKDKQFDIIFEIIKKEKPNCVIFESSQKELEIIRTENKREREKYHGEKGIIYNFLEENIIKIGADLELFEPLSKLNKKRFSQNEIDAYKIYQIMISKMKIDKQLVEEAIRNACKCINVSMNKDIKKIMKDYSLIYNKKELQKLTILDDLTICPLFEGDKLSKVARKISELRDFNIINITLKTLKKYPKVVLLNGENHLVRHKKIFKKYLKKIKW